jgi:hypothetical protein
MDLPVVTPPKFVNAADAVEAFVPPFTIGNTPVRLVAALDATLTKSDPFHATKHFSPEIIVTPVVGPEPRKTIEPVPALMTTYALLCAGAVTFRVVAPLLAVHKITAFLAWFAAPVVVVSVTSALALKVVVPATEESINDVIESLTVVPHVPDKSPVVGSAKPSKGEKLVTAIIYPQIVIEPEPVQL